MTVHQLAIRIDKTGKTALNKFIKHICKGGTQVIITKERGEITKKLHYHAYLKLETNNIYKTEYNRITKLIPELFKGILPHQFCTQKVKTLESYLIYITKGENIQYTEGVAEEFMKQVLKDTRRINREKKMKMKDQLFYEASVNWYPASLNPSDLDDLYIHILQYHIDRNYLPPTRSLLTQYSAFIVTKLKPKQKKEMLLEIYKLV